MNCRISAVAVAGALCAVLATPVLANDDDWAGLYKGLDARDGSVDRLSIVPLGDGRFDIRVVPSRVSHCEGGIGWIVADGRLDGNGTLVRENVFVSCGSDVEPKSVPGGVYTRNEETDILMTEAPDDGRKLYYHRVSDD